VKKSKPKPPVSEARQRLASLIARREELATGMNALSAARERLTSAASADGPISGKLAALSASESAAWAYPFGVGRLVRWAPTEESAQLSSPYEHS
jgi:hypothetical protein